MKTKINTKIIAILFASSLSVFNAQAQTKGSGAMTNTCITPANDGGVAGNVSVGCGAGKAGMTGANNTLLGDAAGSSLTSGHENCAHGFQALKALTTGWNNNAMGYQALSGNTSGTDNNAHGYQSLFTVT